MKKNILTALMLTTLASTTFAMDTNSDAEAEMLSLLTSTGLVPTITSTYSPTLGFLMVSATVGTVIQLDKIKTKQVQVAVNADIEEYHATGNLSVALKQIVEQICTENTLLSETDAVDLIENEVN